MKINRYFERQIVLIYPFENSLFIKLWRIFEFRKFFFRTYFKFNQFRHPVYSKRMFKCNVMQLYKKYISLKCFQKYNIKNYIKQFYHFIEHFATKGGRVSHPPILSFSLFINNNMSGRILFHMLKISARKQLFQVKQYWGLRPLGLRIGRWSYASYIMQVTST